MVHISARHANRSGAFPNASRWAALLLLGFLSPGCGGAASERIPVEGTVTREGQAVNAGALNMVPIEGTKGPSVSAMIRDGKVKLTTEDGPFPGKYRAILREDSADAFRKGSSGFDAGASAQSAQPTVELTVDKSPEITIEFQAGIVNETRFAF